VLRQRGVAHMLIGAYDPQQSWKWERYWRTLKMAASPAEVSALFQKRDEAPHSDSRAQRKQGRWVYDTRRGLERSYSAIGTFGTSRPTRTARSLSH
jgi:hypothetical protein